MEAKDTVINEEEMGVLHRFEDFRLALMYQAELSFKAGKDEGYSSGRIDGYNEATQKAMDAMFEKLQTGRKAGIKEVVEWIDRFGYYNYGQGKPYECEICFERFKWQAKLKDWGIE